MDSVPSSLGSAEVGPTNTRFVVIIIASIAFFLQVNSPVTDGHGARTALISHGSDYELRVSNTFCTGLDCAIQRDIIIV